MLTFQPAIYRDGVLYALPRPVSRLRVQESQDFEQFKVPLRAGDELVGRSSRGIDVLIEGQVGTQGSELLSSEAQMFEELSAFREACLGNGPEETFELIFYQNDESTRKYRGCTCVRFESDLSNPHLFTYSLTIHVEDPRLWTGLPGEES